MKKIYSFLFSVIFCLFIAFPVFAANYPTPSGFVNDFAGLYSSTFKTSLESKLSEFNKSTGNEISVVTIQSLEGGDIESYAVTLFEKWKIGKKGKDNGLLLLIAKVDRKIRIEVGYGLEPYITDGRAGEIIRNQIAPEFKKENYEGGTQAAVDQIITYIINNDIAPITKSSNNGGGSDAIVTIGIILFYIFASYLAGYLGRTKEIWPGGLIGGILGGLGGLAVASVAGLIIGALIFGPVGLLLDYLLTKNYNVRKSRGLSTGFFSTWGGFGGGGSSGGGFGGFGGGSSGGGGASGGW